HPILQTTENLERAEEEEEEGVGVVLSYSGKGAWKCAICSKSFRRRRRAVLHVLNKHKNTRIRCNGACGIADWYVGGHATPFSRAHSLLPSHILDVLFSILIRRFVFFPVLDLTPGIFK
ncbi:hypothetical protein FRC16_007518, partial [Serendipita sp. 398]